MTTQSLSPVCSLQAQSLSVPDWAGVAMGASHACALFNQAEDGAVWCWGDNSSGQLGISSLPNGATFSDTALSILSLPDGPTNPAVQISAGGGTTCTVQSDGTVWCWGDNGLGSSATARRPRDLPQSRLQGSPMPCRMPFTGGEFACAVLANGTVDCWGSNTNGQLGNQTITSSATPQPVFQLTGAVAISAGTTHACALGPTAGLWCWGDNSSAQLGEGSTTTGAVPTRVLIPQLATQVSGCSMGCPPAVSVTAVTCGDLFTCVLLANGTAECWGDNTSGQLGNGMVGNGPSLAPQSSTEPVVGCAT